MPAIGAARIDRHGCSGQLPAPLATALLSRRSSAACLAAVIHCQASVTDSLQAACCRCANDQLMTTAVRLIYKCQRMPLGGSTTDHASTLHWYIDCKQTLLCACNGARLPLPFLSPDQSRYSRYVRSLCGKAAALQEDNVSGRRLAKHQLWRSVCRRVHACAKQACII